MSLLDKMDSQKNVGMTGAQTDGADKVGDSFLVVKRKIHSDIIDRVNKQGKASVDKETMRQFINEAVNDDEYLIPRTDRVRIASDIFNDIMG